MTLTLRPALSKRPDSRFHRALFKLSRSLPLAGFQARAFLPDAEDRMRITAQLAAAIQLLSRHAPIRLAALQRDLPRILVGPTHHLAECIYASSMCLLQFEYVADPKTSPLKLAMTLVHEGTHARLLRAGFPYEERLRRRVERLCVLSEIIFARRVPDSDADVSSAVGRLDRSDQYWSNASFDKFTFDALRQMGFLGRVSYYPVRLLVWLRNLMRKRAA